MEDILEHRLRALAHAGALPFLALAILIWIPDPRTAGALLEAFRIWSALVLCFLGAVWWGLLLAAPGRHDGARESAMAVAGVVPVMLAVPALWLPAAPGLAVAVTGYLLFRWLERLPSHRALYPSWYDRLRARLSWLVVICHMGMLTWALTGYHRLPG